MEKITVVVPARYVAALLLFAPVSDAARSYLESILIEIGSGEMRLVATDGKRLGVARVVHDESLDLETPVHAVAPRGLLEGIKANSPVHVVIVVGPLETASGNARSITVRANGVDRVGQTLDATYPDWRRVIPRTVSGVTAQFNPLQVADLAKVRAALEPKGDRSRVRIAHNGGDAALVSFDSPDFMGVLMPVVYDPEKTSPVAFASWIEDDLGSLV